MIIGQRTCVFHRPDRMYMFEVFVNGYYTNKHTLRPYFRNLISERETIYTTP